MADKISTLILTVNLECRRCYKKIQRVIDKYPGEIESYNFDKKNKKVIVSGPFDPEKLKRNFCDEACGDCIEAIQIKPPEKPKPPPPPKPDPPPKPNPPPPKPDPPPPKPDPPPPKPDPPPPKPDPPPPKPAPPPPEPVLPVPGIPVGPYAPMVCCGPCYEGYPEHGICTRFGYERGTCNIKFFSEEDPSCTIM